MGLLRVFLGSVLALLCGSCGSSGNGPSSDAGSPPADTSRPGHDSATAPDAGSGGQDGATADAPGSADGSSPGIDLSSPTCGLTNDTSNHVPDATAWATFAPPGVGTTYTDSPYGCAVTRLTDSVGSGAASHHYYGTIEPVSANDTYVTIFSSDGSFRIIASGAHTYAAGTEVVAASSMPADMNTESNVEWDRTDDALFWVASAKNELHACTITGINTVSCTTNHTFAEYAGYRITFMDETSMTPNGWLALVGQNTEGQSIDVFLWNPTTQTKSPVYTTTCTADINSPNNGCLHKLIATPNDGIVIGFPSNGGGAEQGNRLWESPWLMPLPHIENLTDHLDCMKDLAGNEVCAFEDFQDHPGPWPGCTNSYRPTLVQIGDGPAPISNELCMFDMPTELGWDVGTDDWPKRPWVVYSAQGSYISSPAENCNNGAGYAAPSMSNWYTYENEILLVRADAKGDSSKVFRLALDHERGKCGSGFWDDPRAAISFDGRYVLFDSNSPWAATGCGSDSTECTDVFMIGPLFGP